MADTELQKVETVMFQISHGDGVGVSLMWKDGSLYLSVSKIMITDGERWYAVPFEDLKDVSAGDEGYISLKIDGAEIKIRGESAERLMAFRHLLLPLIEKRPEDEEILEELIKMILLGIKDKRVIASLLKRDVSAIEDAMKKAEKLGYIDGGRVTEKGKSILSDEEKEIMRKAGVDV